MPNKKIYYLEPNEAFSFSVQYTINQMVGYECIIFTDAVQLSWRLAHDEKKPAAIILYNARCELSGINILTELRQLKYEDLIVMLSGSQNIEEVLLWLNKDNAHFIPKGEACLSRLEAKMASL